MRVQQLLLTRFNIRWPAVGYKPDRPPGWLERRFELFEQFCAPSVAAQTEPDFDWILFCDESTGQEALDRLSSFDSRIRIALVPPWEKTGRTLEALFTRHHTRPDAELVISTRLDSDDALSCRALRHLRELVPQFVATGHERWLHNPALGYKLDARQNRLFATTMHNSPFLTMFERAEAGPVGPYSGNHTRLHETYPTFQDDSARLWMQVVHDGNVTNRVKPGDREVPLSEVEQEFAIDGRRETQPTSLPIDRISEVYRGEIMATETQRRARDRIDWLVAQARGDVIDVGCSQGIAAFLCAERGLQVLGIDIQAEQIAYALAERERQPAEIAERVEFRVGDAATFGFPDDRFDTVLVGEVLEHLDELGPFLAEIGRVCKPDGVIALTTPFGIFPHEDHSQTFFLASLVTGVGEQLRIDSLDIVDGYFRVVARPGAMSPEERDALVLELQPAYEERLAELHAELHRAREERYRKSLLAQDLDRRLIERRAALRRTRWKLRAHRLRRWSRLGDALGRALAHPGRLLVLPRDVIRATRKKRLPPRPRRPRSQIKKLERKLERRNDE